MKNYLLTIAAAVLSVVAVIPAFAGITDKIRRAMKDTLFPYLNPYLEFAYWAISLACVLLVVVVILQIITLRRLPKGGGKTLSVALLSGMLIFGGVLPSPSAFAHNGPHHNESGSSSYLLLVQEPLIHASFHGNVVEVKRLLDGGSNPDVVLEGAKTTFGMAMVHGHTEIVKMLLAVGANPNLVNDYGSTPLHAAARHGRSEAVKLLLAAGTDVHKTTKNGKTALDLAKNKGHSETAAILRNYTPGQYDHLLAKKSAGGFPETGRCYAFWVGIVPSEFSNAGQSQQFKGYGETYSEAEANAREMCQSEGMVGCSTTFDVDCENE